MKIKSLLIIFFSWICCMLVGCKGTQPTELLEPSNLKVVECILTWDTVENADEYVVFVNDKKYKTTENTFDISFLEEEGKYVIKVMALSDDEAFTASNWAKFTYVVSEEDVGSEDEGNIGSKEEEERIPTEGLKYTLLEDGTGYEVHRGEANLEGTIIFPDTYNGLPVKKISKMAFQLAEKPDLLRGIGINGKTTGVRLPKYLEEIGDNAFGFCVNLSKAVIPAGVKKIGKEAFFVTALEGTVQIPEGVEEIGEYAFGCTFIVEAQLPDSLKHIPEGLFVDCSDLEKIRFPERIESFGGYVVDNTKWYDNFPNDYVEVQGFLLGYKGTATVIAIPETVTYIVDRAFSNVYARTGRANKRYFFEKAVFPGSVVLGEELFYKNEYLKEIVLEEGITSIPYRMCYECRGLEKATIPQSVQKIEKGAFFKTALTEIVLPSNLSAIGVGAFSGSKIEEITWPDNLMEIGTNAFGSCKFKELNLPQSVVTIGDNAFTGCTMESVTLPSGVEYIGSRAFSLCKKLTSFYIPDSVTYMGEEVFEGCKLLEDIVLPKGMEILPMGTFNGCKGLKTISLPTGIKEIGEWAFSGCISLEAIDLPTGIKEIGEWAFNNCSSLEAIQLPNNLETIGGSAFNGCEKFKTLSLPDSVKTVGSGCFSNCTLLEEMDLSNVENIGSHMFTFCKALKKAVLPKHLTSIPKSFFMSCSSLTEIVLPKGVTTISQYAFSSCSALQTIYFEGTEEEFSQIVVEEKNNDAFFNANVVFYSETEPQLNSDGTAYDGNYWYYATDNKTPIAWRKET